VFYETGGTRVFGGGWIWRGYERRRAPCDNAALFAAL
jgi:hypothetical protein